MPSIDDLNDTCLLNIFSYFSLYDLLSLPLVCKRWKYFLNHNFLWKNLYFEFFEEGKQTNSEKSNENEDNWKQYFSIKFKEMYYSDYAKKIRNTIWNKEYKKMKESNKKEEVVEKIGRQCIEFVLYICCCEDWYKILSPFLPGQKILVYIDIGLSEKYKLSKKYYKKINSSSTPPIPSSTSSSSPKKSFSSGERPSLPPVVGPPTRASVSAVPEKKDTTISSHFINSFSITTSPLLIDELSPSLKGEYLNVYASMMSFKEYVATFSYWNYQLLLSNQQPNNLEIPTSFIETGTAYITACFHNRAVSHKHYWWPYSSEWFISHSSTTPISFTNSEINFNLTPQLAQALYLSSSNSITSGPSSFTPLRSSTSTSTTTPTLTNTSQSSPSLILSSITTSNSTSTPTLTSSSTTTSSLSTYSKRLDIALKEERTRISIEMLTRMKYLLICIFGPILCSIDLIELYHSSKSLPKSSKSCSVQ